VGGKRNAHMILTEKPEAKRALGRCKLRWDDNVKVVLKEIEC
jgi:hypothetical protein